MFISLNSLCKPVLSYLPAEILSGNHDIVVIALALMMALALILMFFCIRAGKNRNRYQSIIKNINDAIIVLNLERKIRYLNPAASKLIGIKQDRALGKVINSILDLKYKNEAFDSDNSPVFRAMNGERVIYKDDINLVTKHGKALNVYLSVSPFYKKWNDINGCVLTIRDQSAEKHEEETISHWKKRYEFVAAASSQVIYDYDIKTGEIKWSRSIKKVFGYELEEINTITKRLDLIHLEDLKAFEELMDEAVNYYKPYNTEYRLKHISGEYIHVIDEGMYLPDLNRILGVIRDISDYKQAREEISKFKEIWDNANYGAYIAKLSGTITYINNYFANVHGYSADELIGKNISIFHSQEQMNILTKAKSDIFKKGSFKSLEIWHTHKNGKIFPMLMNGILLKDKSGEPELMAATAIDIREQKQYETALKVSEERNRTLISNIPGAVYRRLPDAQWTMQYLSNEIENISGYPAYDFIKNTRRSYADIIFFDDKPMVGQTAYVAMKENKPYIIEYRILHKDKTLRWVYEKGQGISGKDGSVLWCDGVIIDITNRKLAEQALIESEERLKLKLDFIMSPDVNVMDYHLTDIIDVEKIQSILDDFSIANDVSGMILNRNGKLITRPNLFSGITEKLNIKFNLSSELKPEEIENLLQSGEILTPKYIKCKTFGIAYAIAPIIVGNQHIASWIIGKVIKIDEENEALFLENCDIGLEELVADKYVSSELKPERFTRIIQLLTHIAQELSALGYNNLKLAKEITDRKTAEASLQKSEQELREANASKDKFFSIIAHDLKNPLAGLKGITEMLNENLNDFAKDDLQNMILEMKNSASHVFKLLEDLLQWSRSQTGKINYNPDVVDLKIIAESNIFLLKSNAERKKINLMSDITENTYAFADANMITTVVRNLVSNAIKFTDTGGTIVIIASEEDSFVEVAVQDDGVGMDKEMVGKLFRIDQGITTLGTNQEKGTGLGLILCKEFVEQNKGKIWVESAPGKGSSFKFTLPKSSIV